MLFGCCSGAFRGDVMILGQVTIRNAEHSPDGLLDTRAAYLKARCMKIASVIAWLLAILRFLPGLVGRPSFASISAWCVHSCKAWARPRDCGTSCKRRSTRHLIVP